MANAYGEGDVPTPNSRVLSSIRRLYMLVNETYINLQQSLFSQNYYNKALNELVAKEYRFPYLLSVFVPIFTFL